MNPNSDMRSYLTKILVSPHPFILILLFILASPTTLYAQESSKRGKGTFHEVQQNSQFLSTNNTGQRVACVDGMAGGFPCQNADLLSFLTIQDLLGGLDVSASATNDIWGWTDPLTGIEYALVGMNGGTSFVDIRDPLNPVVIGFLPTQSRSSLWRDIKVYAGHAYIVADNASLHGMQVFDLSQLRDVSEPPVQFEHTALYEEFGSAHNIAINEDTGYAYVVGAGSSGTTCGGALHMINIQEPAQPEFAGCFADTETGFARTGYTHDVQCVIYEGPDLDYQGREICFGSNETAFSIADVTEKSSPQRITSVSYPRVAYTHQGWLTEDQRYFFMGDELDETSFSSPRTIVWDILDLDDPVVATTFEGNAVAIDHNQYIVGDYLYQSNYTSGLRVLDIRNPLSPNEVAFFDVLPNNEQASFNGSWSNYPFFESGSVIATSMGEGLFIIDPFTSDSVAREELPAENVTLGAAFPNPFQDMTTLILPSLQSTQRVDVAVYDMAGRKVGVLFQGTVVAGSAQSIEFSSFNLPAGQYVIRAQGDSFSDTQVVTIVR